MWRKTGRTSRKCCNLKRGRRALLEGVGNEVGRRIEQLIDEPILLAGIDPACLPLADHVDGFVSGDCSPRRSKLPKALLGFDARLIAR